MAGHEARAPAFGPAAGYWAGLPPGPFTFTLTRDGAGLRGVAHGPGNVENVEYRRERP